MLPLFALIGCIERVTDVAVPLDPAFYEGGGGADNPSGAASALGIPWNGSPGEKVDVVFAITSPTEGAIQFDVVVPDAAAPGGVKRIGRVESQEMTVTLSVPKTVPLFTIEVFQDPGSDGPSDDDPYATQSVDVATALAAGAPVAVTLVLGARPAPSEAGPGGGGGGVAEPWLGAVGEVITFTAEILTEVRFQPPEHLADILVVREVRLAAPYGQHGGAPRGEHTRKVLAEKPAPARHEHPLRHQGQPLLPRERHRYTLLYGLRIRTWDKPAISSFKPRSMSTATSKPSPRMRA